MANVYMSKRRRMSREACQRIGMAMEKLGPAVTPKMLLDYARPKTSPIHDEFEWDDSVAAESYRLKQAAGFIREIEIVIRRKGQSFRTRAFHSVVISRTRGDDENSSRAFVPVHAVIKNKDYAKQVVANALMEAKMWRQKYKEYTRIFGAVFRAIDELPSPDTEVVESK